MSTSTEAPLDSIEISKATSGRFFHADEPEVVDGFPMPDETPYQHAAGFSSRYSDLLPYQVSKVLSGYVACEIGQEVTGITGFDHLIGLVMDKSVDSSQPEGPYNGVQLSFAYGSAGFAYGWDVNVVSPRRLHTPNARHTLQLYVTNDKLAAFRAVRDPQGQLVVSEVVNPWCVYAAIHSLTASDQIQATAQKLRERSRQEKDALIQCIHEQKQAAAKLRAEGAPALSVEHQAEKMAKTRKEKVKRLQEIGFIQTTIKGLMPPGYFEPQLSLPSQN